jgi:hypothetical protein
MRAACAVSKRAERSAADGTSPYFLPARLGGASMAAAARQAFSWRRHEIDDLLERAAI